MPVLRKNLCERLLHTGAILLASAVVIAGTAPRSLSANINPIEVNKAPEPAAPHVVGNRNGFLTTARNLTLHFTCDWGSVRILTLSDSESPVVRYSAHIETDAGDLLAQRLLEHYSLKTAVNSAGVTINGALPAELSRGKASGAQFWVAFEITVPKNYNVDVQTQAGDIETEDLDGTVSLKTEGGNIRAGRINPPAGYTSSGGHAVLATLRTEGGHIQISDVAGSINAYTAGGHINAGSISGDASLRSGGGHIHAGQITGRADLQTDGGNITVGHAESLVTVRTGGGQIDFGEVRGSVHAQTAGGGIRIMYVSGPMEVQSSDGSICLTRVAGAVRAVTSGGTITAWINPDGATGGLVRLAGASQLVSGEGDILVFLPRNLAASIDAVASSGDPHGIEADPGIHLAFQNSPGESVTGLHAMGALNGGGAQLKLRTNSGKIRLQFLDSDLALRESLLREQEARINQRLQEFQIEKVRVLQEIPAENSSYSGSSEKADWFSGLMDRVQVAVNGALREDPDDFQKRISTAPRPTYPSLAQRAGIQGLVRLQVRVTKDGHVTVEKILEGEPVLANAAIAVLKQWRGKPATLNGKDVDVVSSVAFNFQLNDPMH